MRQLIKLSAEAQAAIRESLFETLNDALIPESDRKAAAWGELYETDMYYFNLTEADDAVLGPLDAKAVPYDIDWSFTHDLIDDFETGSKKQDLLMTAHALGI
jgi:hypothetical protein